MLNSKEVVDKVEKASALALTSLVSLTGYIISSALEWPAL